jgi:GIY-YIG catalytic domain
MPRTCKDYTKSVVYRIVQNNITHYIGSTTNFVKRKANHKSDCNNEKKKSFHFPIYKYIRANGGWENGFKMVLIQEYPLCKNSLELEKYELDHCDAYEPDLNARRPCITDEDRKNYSLTYYNDNKAVFLKRSKDYYLNNKAHCKEKCRIYYLKKKAEKA